MLGLQNEREWAAFCDKVLDQANLATDPRFSSNSRRTAARQELRAIIVEAFSRLTADQVIERLDAAQIANARMNSMHEVWDHEQLKARQRWVDVETPAGRIPLLVPPGLPNGYAPRMDAVPTLGEHTETLLREAGYDDDAIARLRAEQAI